MPCRRDRPWSAPGSLRNSARPGGSDGVLLLGPRSGHSAAHHGLALSASVFPVPDQGQQDPNRIFSTGHDTDLADHGVPCDALMAYHLARAKGGAGLIVVQVVAVH